MYLLIQNFIIVFCFFFSQCVQAKGSFLNYVDKRRYLGRWFVKCQHYLMSLFSKNVNRRQVGTKKSPIFGQRSLGMTPNTRLQPQQAKAGHNLKTNLAILIYFNSGYGCPVRTLTAPLKHFVIASFEGNFVASLCTLQ